MGLFKGIFGGKSYTRKNGKTVHLLNPSEKAGKFAYELKHDRRFTNLGETKGDAKFLTPEQAAYRSGYLDARKDGARAWKAKHGLSKSKQNRQKMYEDLFK